MNTALNAAMSTVKSPVLHSTCTQGFPDRAALGHIRPPDLFISNDDIFPAYPVTLYTMVFYHHVEWRVNTNRLLSP
jgi:hypothetical protein